MEVFKECIMAHSRYAAALAKKREEEQKGATKEKGQWTIVDGKIMCSSIIRFRQKNQVHNQSHILADFIYKFAPYTGSYL